MNPNGSEHWMKESLPVLDRVRSVMAERDISQATVAKEARLSATVLSQLFSGTYPGNVEAQEAKLGTWLRGLAEKRATQQLIPDAPAFFECTTSRELMNGFRYAQSIDDMVSIVGAPGIGKSTTCREYQRTHSNVWLATMAAHTTGVVPVLREVCDAVSGSHANGASALAREICRKIRGTGGLLIIDEAHHISLQALDAIRALHDSTDTAVALVGSIELAGKLERMPQLYSRLGIRLNRPRVLTDDVNALMDAWQIQGRPERRFVTSVAKGPGALRTVTKMLRLATSLARANDESLTLQHIRDAADARSARYDETGDE